MANCVALARCITFFSFAMFLLAGLSCIAPSDDSRINQLKATQTLISIREAEKAFKIERGRYGTLQELITAGLLDQTLSSGSKDGYKFEITSTEDKYKALATPQHFKVTGAWAYYLDETGVLRGSARDGITVGTDDYPVNTQ